MNPFHENPYHRLQTILTILLASVLVKGEGGCRDLEFLDCLKNNTLAGHVIKSFRILAPGLKDCQNKCFIEDRCVSYNLSPVEGIARTCELNDADHWMWAHHVVDKEDFEYCPIKNRCSSSPCPSNQMCVPDFAWDSFSCVDGLWTQWTSWSACHDLPDCPRTRTRNCTNPAAPQNIGTNCDGSAVDSDNTTCQIPAVNTTGCESPLGMENRTILDSQITASSWAVNQDIYKPHGARLNNQVAPGTSGAWSAGGSRKGEYIQVDLGRVKKVTKIATQGRPFHLDQWVTEYSVSYSNDTSDWTNYYGDCVKIFPGNSDQNTVVTNKFEIPITARYIRVIVQKWSEWPSMRMELYGCTPP